MKIVCSNNFNFDSKTKAFIIIITIIAMIVAMLAVVMVIWFRSM